MSGIFDTANPACAGCETISLCERAVQAELSLLEQGVYELEMYIADAEARRIPKMSAAGALILHEAVEVDFGVVKIDISNVVAAAVVCPGKKPDGSCGKTPQEQLQMLPQKGVNLQDPHYLAIRASQG